VPSLPASKLPVCVLTIARSAEVSIVVVSEALLLLSFGSDV